MPSQLMQATRRQLLNALRTAARPKVKTQPGMEAHHTGRKFADIAEEFLATRQIVVSQIMVKANEKGQFPKLVDRDLAREFRAFHDARAQLVMLTHAEHVRVHQQEFRR